MAKNNVKTLRLSDEIIEMIESQAGETFTAKFEALVTRCVWELPKKEQELRGINEQIDYQRKRLARIRKQAMELDHSVAQMESTARNYIAQIRRLTKSLEDMDEET